MFRPETAAPMRQLAEVLLRGDNTLTRGERELIAAYVSNLNECEFCQASHSSFAALQLDGGMPVVDQVKADPETAPISDKLRALLAIAAKVRQDGRLVSDEDVEAARAEGATDVEIHDTVLIAAAFLDVQPLRRWSRHADPDRPRGVRRDGARHRRAGLRSLKTALAAVPFAVDREDEAQAALLRGRRRCDSQGEQAHDAQARPQGAAAVGVTSLSSSAAAGSACSAASIGSISSSGASCSRTHGTGRKTSEGAVEPLASP